MFVISMMNKKKTQKIPPTQEDEKEKDGIFFTIIREMEEDRDDPFGERGRRSKIGKWVSEKNKTLVLGREA
jgi:hypothetical protein